MANPPANLNDPKSPYILWIDYGTEGWKPWANFSSPENALAEAQAQGYGPWLITKTVQFKEEETNG